MKNNLTAIIITGVILGGVGFFAGMKYQQFRNQPFGRMGVNGRQQFTGGRMNQNGFRPISGEITSKDDKSITVKSSDGSSKIIFISEKTSVNKEASGTMSDLTTGSKVAIFGTENSDGSVTANAIQLNPSFQMQSNRNPSDKKKSDDAKEYIIESSNFKFSVNKLNLKKGEKARIVLKNIEGTHDLKIDDFNQSTAVISTGQEDFFEFTPDRTGTFEYYCSIGNHRAMGMKGTLTVE